MKPKHLEVLFEFLIFGIVIGVVEDLIAVKFTTGASITWHTVGLVVLIAIPFAILGELIADHIDFVKLYKRIFRKKNGTHEDIDVN